MTVKPASDFLCCHQQGKLDNFNQMPLTYRILYMESSLCENEILCVKFWEGLLLDLFIQ